VLWIWSIKLSLFLFFSLTFFHSHFFPFLLLSLASCFLSCCYLPVLLWVLCLLLFRIATLSLHPTTLTCYIFMLLHHVGSLLHSHCIACCLVAAWSLLIITSLLLACYLIITLSLPSSLPSLLFRHYLCAALSLPRVLPCSCFIVPSLFRHVALLPHFTTSCFITLPSLIALLPHLVASLHQATFYPPPPPICCFTTLLPRASLPSCLATFVG